MWKNSELVDALSDGLGDAENLTKVDACAELEMANGSQAHGGHAAALRTIRVAAELTGSDAGLKIGGKGLCSLREDAIAGIILIGLD